MYYLSKNYFDKFKTFLFLLFFLLFFLFFEYFFLMKLFLWSSILLLIITDIKNMLIRILMDIIIILLRLVNSRNFIKSWYYSIYLKWLLCYISSLWKIDIQRMIHKLHNIQLMNKKIIVIIISLPNEMCWFDLSYK